MTFKTGRVNSEVKFERVGIQILADKYEHRGIRQVDYFDAGCDLLHKVRVFIIAYILYYLGMCVLGYIGTGILGG